MKPKKIVFATANPNKLKEVSFEINSFEIIGLKNIGITEEIPETGATLKENAILKAKYVYNKTGLNCFADDIVASNLISPVATPEISVFLLYLYLVPNIGVLLNVLYVPLNDVL